MTAERPAGVGEQDDGDRPRVALSRRGFLTVSALGVSVAVLGPAAAKALAATPSGASPSDASPSAAATLGLQAGRFGAVFVGDRSPRFAVTADADAVRWTVRDLWGTAVGTGTRAVRGRTSTITVQLHDEGYYTLDVTALHGTAAVATERISFALLAPYRLPADSPFGANTHLQPPSMVPLMAALGITWARTDLTWTEIEPPPLAGWSSEVYQADASVALDPTVAHSGTSSVKIVNRSPIQDNYYATVAQEIPVQPNTTYTFSAWVKGVSVKALQFTVKPDWGSRIDAPGGTFDWTNVTFQYTTGSESTLNFRLLANDVTDSAWMDDVVLLNQVHVNADRYDGKTIEQLRVELSGTTGENVVIRRFARFAVGA